MPLPAFSLSKTWNVARLTSAISSSLRVIATFGANGVVCGTSAVGTADAAALPSNEKVNPAAPNADAAALVTRFCFETCFTRGMVASSVSCCEGATAPGAAVYPLDHACFPASSGLIQIKTTGSLSEP
jgi:hypothetical protein